VSATLEILFQPEKVFRRAAVDETSLGNGGRP
jgi:hypothetical protein